MDEHNYSESDLRTNLNELAHETVREFYIASKKASVYSVSHPLTQKAIGRPFLLMERAFRYKRFFNFHIAGGQLYVLNIRVRASVFTEQVMEYMQILDLRDILFDNNLTAGHLALFLDRFVKRLPATDYQNLMMVHLEKNKIDSVHINSDRGTALFENGPKFMGDMTGDFSVRSIVAAFIGSDFIRLAEMLAGEGLPSDQYISRFNHDFNPRLIKYLIPEKIAALEPEPLVQLLKQAMKSNMADDSRDGGFDAGRMPHLIQALNYHPGREDILSRLGTSLTEEGIKSELFSAALPQTTAIKIESSEKIDQFLAGIFSREAPPGMDADFGDHFGRLLRTGQQGKARAVLNLLVDHLAGDNLDFRRHALALLEQALALQVTMAGNFLIEHLVGALEKYLAAGKETFEFSDLIWKMAQIALLEKRYESLAALCAVMLKYRSIGADVATYESFAVKKAISELNRREIINQLIWELVEGRHTEFPHIKNILVTIGSEEVALALATIISHESRQVRQYVLKILSELGKASLNVFTRIMEDNGNFEREDGKRELPDARWYIIRNSIFVLGAIQDPEGCRALRARLADPDTRVRRAIISALEKIGGEQAVDLLMILADDPDREIREAAIIALGLVGKAENSAELISLALMNKSEITSVIATLGRLGGDDARKFLASILADPSLLGELTSNRSSREEMRLAAIKALGKMGDRLSLDKIKEFSDSLSATQKLFFGGSKLNKAAEDILNRHDK